MKRLVKMVALSAVLALASMGTRLDAQGADPVIGTWELNVAKSTYHPGPAPKSQTRTYEAAGQAVKYTGKGVDAEGKDTLAEYTAGYDGKDVPMTGSPDADMISLKKIDARTAQATLKKGGKVVITSEALDLQGREDHEDHVQRGQREGREGQQHTDLRQEVELLPGSSAVSRRCG